MVTTTKKPDRKSCWTCKDRRVPCDGGVPTCRKCTRSRRECQGYGIRLSWPKTGDSKRAMTAVSTGRQGLAYASSEHFISTTWRDMEVYRRKLLLAEPIDPIKVIPSGWVRPRKTADYMELLRHFYTTAYKSLVTFGTINTDMRHVLMHMARSYHTPAGLGLFSALLAFSSLHRDGLNEQAMQFKVSAIQCLASVADGASLTQFEAGQHVAASMLLGAFEILLPSGNSGEWLSYVFGAMDMTQASHLQSQPCSEELRHLLDWVHYQNTIARFPVHHWRRRDMLASSDPGLPVKGTGLIQQHALSTRSLINKHRPSAPSPNPSHAILNLLSDAFDSLLDPRDPRVNTTDYQIKLESLEQRAKTLIISANTTSNTTTKPHDLSEDPKHTAHVFQIAARIYLARATHGTSLSSSSSSSPSAAAAHLEAEIETVFSTFIKSCSCPHFFPLFVTACEARTDDRRRAILSLLGRVEGGDSDWTRGTLRGLRSDIERIWVQQDLHADSELLENYLGVMGSVVGLEGGAHSFV